MSLTLRPKHFPLNNISLIKQLFTDMMKIVKQVKDLKQPISAWKRDGLTVGFVPTMGNLHEGHLSLVEVAKQCCDKVVVSIFVNPSQFGPNEDFDSYPRTFKADQTKLQSLSTDLLFYPSVDEVYPGGVDQTVVQVPGRLTEVLEGATRPHHFDGVTTVVTKLFNMVQPDKAVFGQKDFQQLAVIQSMVADLAMPIDIVSAPIGRDVDGLALSSRNQYLTPAQRAISPLLSQVIFELAAQINAGQREYFALEQSAIEQLLASGFDGVDYISVRHAKTLLPAEDGDRNLVVLAVARLGKTRLLDNVLVKV